MQKALSATAARYAFVLLAAGVLYVISCAPGALWQDSGLIQYRVWHNDIEGFLGLAISHPLYYLVAFVAKSVPFGSFAHRVNLVSALAAAVAVANLYLLVRLWLGRDFPAVVAALTFALSHTFWRHAAIAETYTLWTALFLGELIVLLQYTRTRRVDYLYGLGLLNGLAVAVHMLACLPLLCYVVLVIALLPRKAIRPRSAVVFVLLWGLGALPYEVLIVKNVVQTGDLLGTLASAAFGQRWQGDVLNTSLSWGIVKENLAFFALNFPTPNVLLFFAGCYALGQAGAERAFRRILVTLLVLFFVFAFRYTVSDRYAFFIPFYCIVSILIGLGAHAVGTKLGHGAIQYAILIFALVPATVYAAAPNLAQRWSLPIGTRGDIPYRNDYAYFLQPWKTGYRGAERFAAEALETVAVDAAICADTTTVAPLLHVQEVKGTRPDVKIITGIVRSVGAPPYDEQTLDRFAAAGRLYVTSKRPDYIPAFVLDKYELVRAGVLWHVVQPQPEAH